MDSTQRSCQPRRPVATGWNQCQRGQVNVTIDVFDRLHGVVEEVEQEGQANAAASESKNAMMMFRSRGGPTGLFGNLLGVAILTSLPLFPFATSSSRFRCSNVLSNCLLVSSWCVSAIKSIVSRVC